MIHSCRTRADFERLSREGVRRSGATLWVRHVTDVTCTPPRVGFALSRRNGSAPRRNRLRRQLRALLREDGLDVSPGLYLIGHKGPIVPMKAADLRHDLSGVLGRFGVER